MKRLCFFAFLAVVIAQQFSDLLVEAVANDDEFVRRNGLQFILNGKTYYANGFNAYWLTYEATDPTQRFQVTTAFQNAIKNSLTVARTWAFRDGGYRALQTAPGIYDEQTFQGLDFVIAEAKRLGVKLILTFVNNYSDFGGRKQYIEWAKSQGQSLSSEDDFYTNSLVKDFYKNHIKTLVNRVNTFTKIAYKDEPTIMAWELMNEPQCKVDPSGKILQAWIDEMATYVKSLDSNHLLTTGLEGFYGDSSPQRKTSLNPAAANVLGTDFVANHASNAIDFVSVHSYPDEWFPNLDENSRLNFSKNWLEAHIEDAQNILKKPLILGEFGKSTQKPGYSQIQRDTIFNTAYDVIYSSARNGGSAAGGLFWHLVNDGMDNFKDGYSIILSEKSSTVDVIRQQSQRLGLVNKKGKLGRKIKK